MYVVYNSGQIELFDFLAYSLGLPHSQRHHHLPTNLGSTSQHFSRFLSFLHSTHLNHQQVLLTLKRKSQATMFSQNLLPLSYFKPLPSLT